MSQFHPFSIGKKAYEMMISKIFAESRREEEEKRITKFNFSLRQIMGRAKI